MTMSRALNPEREDPRVAAVRAQLRALERHGSETEVKAAVRFEIPEIDGHLAAGGLEPALHEAAAGTLRPGDDAAATLFLSAIAARFSRRQGDGQVLWAVVRRGLFAPALAQAGLTPDRVLYAECRDDAEVLAVMEDGLRHGGLAAVVGEVKRATMASARRLQLGTEDSGAAALLLRHWHRKDGDPLAALSPAVTRWRIACAPAAPLPHAGIGRARWVVELVRQRGGPPHHWLLEAPDAEARFALAARSGDRPDQADGADRIAIPARAA